MGRGADTQEAQTRSVRFTDTEKWGYSSDRGSRKREGEHSVRRTRPKRLAPSNRLSYQPASLILLAGAEADASSEFAKRLFNKGSVSVFDPARIAQAITGEISQEERHAKTQTLLSKVAVERLRGGGSVVIDSRALDPAERAEWVKLGNQARRPVHLIFLDSGSSDDETAGQAAALRKAIEQDRMGEEGFSSVLTLTRNAANGVMSVGFDLDLRSRD